MSLGRRLPSPLRRSRALSALHVAALAMALADLVRCPSAWNKTAHGVAARPAVAPSPILIPARFSETQGL